MRRPETHSGTTGPPWRAPETGRPLGVRDYCMSCTIVTMMLDGLSREHRLATKPGAAAKYRSDTTGHAHARMMASIIPPEVA